MASEVESDRMRLFKVFAATGLLAGHIARMLDSEDCDRQYLLEDVQAILEDIVLVGSGLPPQRVSPLAYGKELRELVTNEDVRNLMNI